MNVNIKPISFYDDASLLFFFYVYEFNIRLGKVRLSYKLKPRYLMHGV